jgi:tetratricopeptide (TPR) repeat protein
MPPTEVLPKNQAALMQAYSAVVMAPGDAEAYHHLGCLLRDDGDFVAAEQAFRRAIAGMPDNAHYRHQLSALCLSLGRLHEAIDAAEEAIAREPVNPLRYGYLADLLGNAGGFDRARAALEAALAMAPSHVPFRINLSNMFAREGRLDEALETARAITRETSDNAVALGHLAHVEQLLGHRQDAEMHLRSALALAPESDHLRGQFERLMQPKAAA